MDFFRTISVVDSISFGFSGQRKLRGYQWESFFHRSRKKGVRIYIRECGKVFVQCSLPRFQHGYNGRLLTSQSEIDDALQSLIAWLKKGFSDPSEIEFSRVDLCWHLEGDPRFFISSLNGCAHPRIHGVPAIKPDQSLWWGKRGAVRRITGYDKEREQNKRPGKIMRFEVSLRGYALRDDLNNGNPVRHLNFSACYETYRRILVRFNPTPRASLKPGPNHTKRLIAEMEMRGLNFLEDFMGKYRSKQSADRVRKEIRAIKLTLNAVDFNKLLPEKAPPEPMHVLPRQRQKIHPKQRIRS